MSKTRDFIGGLKQAFVGYFFNHLTEEEIPLKGTATLLIIMFYMKDLNKP